ncbi:MAG: hypothetical protein UY62_C0017G0003 [Parcubacteria group bacterium GW2011_GWF2_50_9]|nr:MAG: hypothetical protein UY62_C0017G0003 [Parcubacteria group bacterium GW2011_GWF2_50_9]
MGFSEMNMKNKKKILVAVNDAGGAELLSAYVSKNKSKFDFVCFGSGPASSIMGRYGIKCQAAPEDRVRIGKIMRQHRDAFLVLTGTGWMTYIERDFIKEAKRNGIKTVSFLDHWVNYRERFGYPKSGWKNNLPEEIWVADETAFKMAKRLFPRITIAKIPNYYLLDIVEEYKRLNARSDGSTIVFMSEPIESGKVRCSEFRILQDLLATISVLKRPLKVIIRFHPSEKADKYDDIIQKYAHAIVISKSTHKNIIDDVVRADFILGMTSMSLIVGLACHKRTVSYMPGAGHACALPHKDLIKIKTPVALRHIIKTLA